MAEILNVVQVFSPAQAVTVCYCCYCCSVVSKQKMPKNPGKTRKYLGFSRYFRVLPALDAGDRRGSLPGLPYCCSAGLTLATVVGEPHCCSVVTVNTSNTVQLPTLNSSKQQRSCSARLQAQRALHATERGAVERGSPSAARRLRDTVTDERVGLFTPDKDSGTRRCAVRATVFAARRGTVCGEVGRVLRFPSTQHPHPLA